MKPTIAEITNAVAEAFNLRADNITGPRKLRQYAHPRFIVYSIAHEAGYSYPSIGQRIGQRDHTSVMYGDQQVSKISLKDMEFRETYERLRRDLIGTLVAAQDWQFKSIRSAA